ncbi:MAG: hypothetical protein AAF907_14275, partial [Planctomycetota bacterium]
MPALLHPSRLLLLSGILAAVTLLPGAAFGQGSRSSRDDGRATGREAEEGGEVVIRRRAVFPRDPRPYQFGLHLEPAKKVTLVAPGLGTVASVLVEPGQESNAGAELVTLDSEEQELELKRAEALLNAEEQKGGRGGLLDAAQISVELAKLRLSRRRVRAPFTGTIYEVHVVAGPPAPPRDPPGAYPHPDQMISEKP